MSQAAKIYAQALYALAKDEGVSQSLLEQMDVLNESFMQEPGFIKLLSAPGLPKEERCDVLDNSFRGKVDPYLLNFMKLLTEKGYIRRFSDCCRYYRELYNDDNGILPVRAVTAIPLTGEQHKKLSDKLAKLTGKTIDLSNRVDPTALGGVRLDYDGKRVDGTVKNRLDSIRSLLDHTVL